MRLDEIRVDPFADQISATQFKSLLSRIKNSGLDADLRTASIKNRIIDKWEKGYRTVHKLEMDFEKLGLDLKTSIGEMEAEDEHRRLEDSKNPR